MATLRAFAAFVVTGLAMAQSETGPRFEVASIKPAAPDQRGVYVRNTPGGRLNIANMTLKDMITFAWRIQPFQITGGPPWLDSTRFDISAKPEQPPKEGETPLMLRALLQDRFQLTLHEETRELPVYALVVRKEGKLGPGLTEAKEGSCVRFDPSKPPPPPPQPGKPPTLGCGGFMMSPRQMTASSTTIGTLVEPLSRLLGRTVVDKTGLTGKFDLSLQWTPDESQAIRPGPDGAAAPPSDSAPPSIFTAIQEQLGLKLDSQKGPVKIFVIERAEKPSEN
jgi:uncharacterized protein (TIGR03435 family)